MMNDLPLLTREELAAYLNLVGPSEIAQRAGVSRSMVNKWRERFPDFPQPIAEISMGPVWRWADVEPWIKAQRAKGPGRPKSKD